MAEKRTFLVLASGTDDGPVYCRGWEVPESLLDAVAASLPGEPLEWIWDGDMELTVRPDGETGTEW